MAACSHASAQQYTLSIDASPRRIAADGRSTSQITVRAFSGGAPVTDGLEVRFNTTSGSIVPVARLATGAATVPLTSTTAPSIAQVTAIVGGASAIAEVEFVAGDFRPPDVMITVAGDVGYSVDEGILIAAESSLEHSGLIVTANTLEFDERRGEVRAQGNVTLSKGATTIAGDAIWYKPEEQAGAILIAGKTPQEVSFLADSLSVQDPKPPADIRRFDPLAAPDTTSWITADRAVVWPRERIQFTAATVLVNGRTVLSLPHYNYDYKATPLNPISQQFRYTAFEGLVLDLPFYFQFKQDESSGLRVRYAGKGSSYGGFASPRKGFSLGLERQYMAPGGGGRMFIDSLPTSDRSFEMNHNQTLLGGRFNSSLRYQPRSDYARNALSGYTSLFRSFSGFDLIFSTYGSRSQAVSPSILGSQGTLTVKLDGRTRGRPVGKTGLTWRTEASVARGPLGSGSSRLDTGFYQTLGMGLAHRPIKLLLGSTLTFDTVAERSFGARDSNSLRGRATLSKSIRDTGELSLTWDQEFSGLSVRSSAYRKSLIGTFSAGSPSGLRGIGYLNWIPDQDLLSVQASAYQPLGKNMRLDVTHGFSTAGFEDLLGNKTTSKFGYTKVSLIRPLGLLELSLSWSPQGRDYGLKKDQKFWLEVGSRAF